jgi:hypothetical protein
MDVCVEGMSIKDDFESKELIIAKDMPERMVAAVSEYLVQKWPQSVADHNYVIDIELPRIMSLQAWNADPAGFIQRIHPVDGDAVQPMLVDVLRNVCIPMTIDPPPLLPCKYASLRVAIPPRSGSSSTEAVAAAAAATTTTAVPEAPVERKVATRGTKRKAR